MGCSRYVWHVCVLFFNFLSSGVLDFFLLFSFCRRCRCLRFILSRQCTCHRRAVDTVHIINLINKKSTLPPTRSRRASFTRETMYMFMTCRYIIYCLIYILYCRQGGLHVRQVEKKNSGEIKFTRNETTAYSHY